MKSQNTAGLAYALVGFALLASGDAIVKSINAAWPGTAIAALRYTIGALVLVPLWLAKEGKEEAQRANWKLHWLRGIAVAIGSICFFTALSFMPLAEATVLTFLSPMFAALFSAIFLKEPAPKSVMLASLVAFLGVVIVMRPSFEHAGLAVILPVVCAIAMSALFVLNRLVAGTGSVLAMQALISLTGAIAMIGIAATGHFSGQIPVGLPDASIIVKCGIVACTATLAHTCIYMATVRASAALVAPMTYVQLLVALAIGYFAFNNFPDRLTLTGSGLIVASGLYLWWSTQKKGTEA